MATEGMTFPPADDPRRVGIFPAIPACLAPDAPASRLDILRGRAGG